MNFRQGEKVEIYRKDQNLFSSWHPAKISSAHKNFYAVQYNWILTEEREKLIEKVRKDEIRPRPPKHEIKNKIWVFGDLAEIFDSGCWKLGKVAKVLKGDYVVMKIFGSIQIREFHVSKLRVPLTWIDNCWVKVDKAPEQKQFDDSNKNLKRKRKDESPVNFSQTPNKETFLRAISENEVSVASCSGTGRTEPNSKGQNRRKTIRFSEKIFFEDNDAMSSYPSVESSKEKCKDLDANIHELELLAYQNTVQAFHALGPLTWEQEALLTNLRFYLNISAEEHALQLRQLLST